MPNPSPLKGSSSHTVKRDKADVSPKVSSTRASSTPRRPSPASTHHHTSSSNTSTSSNSTPSNLNIKRSSSKSPSSNNRPVIKTINKRHLSSTGGVSTRPASPSSSSSPSSGTGVGQSEDNQGSHVIALNDEVKFFMKSMIQEAISNILGATIGDILEQKTNELVKRMMKLEKENQILSNLNERVSALEAMGKLGPRVSQNSYTIICCLHDDENVFFQNMKGARNSSVIHDMM